MPSKLQEGETKDEFMGRCMAVMSKEGKHPKDQQVAICFSMWREAHKKGNDAAIEDVSIETPKEETEAKWQTTQKKKRRKMKR